MPALPNKTIKPSEMGCHIENTLLEVSQIELIYKSKVKASLRPKVNTSKDSYDLFKKYWDEGKLDFIEQFKVLILNINNRAIGLFNVSSGLTGSTLADPKLVFVPALLANASGVIVAHYAK